MMPLNMSASPLLRPRCRDCDVDTQMLLVRILIESPNSEIGLQCALGVQVAVPKEHERWSMVADYLIIPLRLDEIRRLNGWSQAGKAARRRLLIRQPAQRPLRGAT